MGSSATNPENVRCHFCSLTVLVGIRKGIRRASSSPPGLRSTVFADSFVQSILQRQTLQVEWDGSEVMWWAQLLVGLVGVEFNAPLDTI